MTEYDEHIIDELRSAFHHNHLELASNYAEILIKRFHQIDDDLQVVRIMEDTGDYDERW